MIGIGTDGVSNPWDGGIDELNMSATGLQAGWITTEYNNEESPSTFYTLGPQQCGTPPPTQILLRHGEYLDACGREPMSW